jgi:exodeoxyribonuclease V alpha subunit
MKRVRFTAIEGSRRSTPCSPIFLNGGTAHRFRPELLTAVALASRAVREGHSCCRLESGRTTAGGGRGTVRLPGFEEWSALLRRPEFRALVAEPVSPLVFDDAGRLYLRRYYECERRIASEIRHRFAVRFPSAARPAGRRSRRAAALFRRPPPDGSGPTPAAGGLHRHVELVFHHLRRTRHRKTTVVAALLALELARNPELSIALCAPTGKRRPGWPNRCRRNRRLGISGSKSAPGCRS